jgi:hypothetical protein
LPAQRLLPVDALDDTPAGNLQPRENKPTPETSALPSDLQPGPDSRSPESSLPAPPAAAELPIPPPEWLWPELPDTWKETPVNASAYSPPPAGLRRDALRRQRLDQEQRGRPWNA